MCELEIDTAGDYSIISKSKYLQNFSNTPLCPSNVNLKTYTGEALDVWGEIMCDVVYKGRIHTSGQL